MTRLSLRSRLALLFAGCTSLVSLIAGVLFTQASASHFVELDQQLFDSQLASLRSTLGNVHNQADFERVRASINQQTRHQPDLRLRIHGADGQLWFDDTQGQALNLPATPGLTRVQQADGDYRVLVAALHPKQPGSPQLTLLLDITHHQHFLQRMQHLIWLTVGLCALATALLGAWAASRGLQPLQRMSRVAASVSTSSLTTRLPEHELPAELAQLTGAFNAMLGRLDDGFQRLSAFSADIAHELRTPLANLLTSTQVTLTRSRTPEAYREALLSNLEELQSLAQMVNDMLLLAKADQGLLAPTREMLDLHGEADALIEFFAPLAEEQRVQLLRQGEARVAADRTLLRRVLSNLLDNALRYTPAQGQILISVQQTSEYAELVVQNDGPAIPAPELPRLFDRFYRADPARSDSHEHAGLGLAISRSIIQAHGGRLHCESGAGLTRFIIELPYS